jgi:DivIVA domain-containing protein
MTASVEGAHRMTGADVRAYGFRETRGLTRGYDEAEVARFVERVARELDERDSELSATREEVDHLKRRILAAEPDRITESVNVLTRAQKTADDTIARADEHSARVMTEARRFYDDARRKAAEIVDEASRQAQEMAEQAAVDHGELAAQTVYLKTLRETTRVQLEAFLMGLYDQVAREYSRAHPQAVAQATPRPQRQRNEESSVEVPNGARPGPLAGAVNTERY